MESQIKMCGLFVLGFQKVYFDSSGEKLLEEQMEQPQYVTQKSSNKDTY